jgi:hypothetical protein
MIAVISQFVLIVLAQQAKNAKYILTRVVINVSVLQASLANFVMKMRITALILAVDEVSFMSFKHLNKCLLKIICFLIKVVHYMVGEEMRSDQWHHFTLFSATI